MSEQTGTGGIFEAVTPFILRALDGPFGILFAIFLAIVVLLWKHGFGDIARFFSSRSTNSAARQRELEQKFEKASEEIKNQFEERIKLLERHEKRLSEELERFRLECQDLRARLESSTLEVANTRFTLQRYEQELRELREQNSGLKSAFDFARKNFTNNRD